MEPTKDDAPELLEHSVSDPVVFWATLSRTQVLALLRAAPKVLGPVERSPRGVAHRNGVVVSTITKIDPNDDALRADGWIVIDEPERVP